MSFQPTTYRVPQVRLQQPFFNEPPVLIPYPAYRPSFVQPNEMQARKTASQPNQRLINAGKAAGLLGAAFLLNHSKLRTVPTLIKNQLFSSDWKDWAKVFMGIAGIDQAEKAMNWEPPVWLKAGLNVVLVTPFVTKLNLKNVIQSLVLAPLVSGLAQFNYVFGEKAEKTLQEKGNVPPLATKITFSLLTTLLGLRIIPAVSRSIPELPKSGQSASAGVSGQAKLSPAKTQDTTRAGVIGGACACCPSVICANDVGQMGAAILDSYQQRNDHKKGPSHATSLNPVQPY